MYKALLKLVPGTTVIYDIGVCTGPVRDCEEKCRKLYISHFTSSLSSKMHWCACSLIVQYQ